MGTIICNIRENVSIVRMYMMSSYISMTVAGFK